MSKLLSRALQLEEEYNNREHTPHLKGMRAYLKYLPIVTWTQEQSDASKSLLLGLTVAMEGSNKEENILGIFSPHFERACNLIAGGLLRTKKAPSLMKERLLAKLIQGAITTFIGLTALAKENAKNKTNEASSDIFLGLILRTALASELPRNTLKAAAESVGLKDPFAGIALETLTLLTLLLTFMPKQEHEQTDLFDTLKESLERNFTEMERKLTDLNVRSKASAPLMLFLRESVELLNQGHYPRFIQEVHTLITSYGLSPELLKEDAEASKRLFSILQEQFKESSETDVNTVSFIG